MYLLVKNFYIVFEAIIDELIGDNPLPDGMDKKQEDIKKEFKWVDTLNYDLKEAEYKEKQKHLEEIEQEINDYKEEIKFWTNTESWYEPIEVDFDKEVDRMLDYKSESYMPKHLKKGR